MTPALPHVLAGIATALQTPLPPEASGDYAAGRFGIVAMLAILAAQEAEKGVAARVWENTAIAEMLGDAPAAPADLSWSALDAVNAALRRRLILLHEDVEARADAAMDRRILQLYAAMAKARRLDLPGG